MQDKQDILPLTCIFFQLAKNNFSIIFMASIVLICLFTKDV